MTVKDVAKVCEVEFIIIKNNEIVHESVWNGLDKWKDYEVLWLDTNKKDKIFLLCSAILLPIFSADYNARRASCVGQALRLGIDMRQPTRATQGEEGI